jgi:hypothetical protein
VGVNAVGGTKAQTLYEYVCQWNWLLIGTDLTGGQIAENRGDRYRAYFQVLANLRQANFPGFCQKQSIVVNPQTGALSYTPITDTNPVSAYESIFWTNPRFKAVADNDKTGLAFGVAAVNVYGYDDVLPALL